MSLSPLAQDHIILVLSTQDFENPPSWLNDNFQILEGGFHTGQPSRNKLIVFADGTYLELFNWIDVPQQTNAWADKSPGLIDFALTSLAPSTAESLHDEIATRLQSKTVDDVSNVQYEEPKSGGRIRKDGVEVRWKLSRPILASKVPSVPLRSSASGYRGDLPFFTHDLTERNVRIPFDDKEKTTHPCGAVGISTVELLFPSSHYSEYVQVYEALLGVSALPLAKTPDLQQHEFRLQSPVSGSVTSRVLSRQQRSAIDAQWTEDRGISLCGLRLAVRGREGHGVQAFGSNEIASTVALEW